jgi:hypothetical protein
MHNTGPAHGATQQPGQPRHTLGADRCGHRAQRIGGGAAPGGDTAAQVRRVWRGEHEGEAAVAPGNMNGARAHR